MHCCGGLCNFEKLTGTTAVTYLHVHFPRHELYVSCRTSYMCPAGQVIFVLQDKLYVSCRTSYMCPTGQVICVPQDKLYVSYRTSYMCPIEQVIYVPEGKLNVFYNANLHISIQVRNADFIFMSKRQYCQFS